MKLMQPVLSGLTLVLVCLALASCGRSPTARFYTLNPVAVEGSSGAEELSIAVGPVDFPRALVRNQIVTRAGDTQLRVDQYNLWGASLDKEFLRVLGENIAAELNTDRVTVYPASAVSDIDYRVSLYVMQFDGVLGDSVTLRSRWKIARNGNEVAVGTFSHTEAVNSGDNSYDSLVAAHSAAIGALSSAISAELKTLGKPAEN